MLSLFRRRPDPALAGMAETLRRIEAAQRDINVNTRVKNALLGQLRDAIERVEATLRQPTEAPKNITENITAPKAAAELDGAGDSSRLGAAREADDKAAREQPEPEASTLQAPAAPPCDALAEPVAASLPVAHPPGEPATSAGDVPSGDSNLPAAEPRAEPSALSERKRPSAQQEKLYSVLVALAAEGDVLPKQVDLAARAGIPLGSTGSGLNELERKGYIRFGGGIGRRSIELVYLGKTLIPALPADPPRPIPAIASKAPPVDEAIAFLREAGHTIAPAGRDAFTFNGARLSTAELLAMRDLVEEGAAG